MKKKLLHLSLALLLLLSLLTGCVEVQVEVLPPETQAAQTPETQAERPVLSADFDLSQIPPYEREAFAAVNGNVPFFQEEEITTEAYESYAPLDALGRCGVTVACLGKELMPTEKRGDISEVKPTGWHNKPYDWVDGEYLYNRCHLIGFQLAGENANDRNLITGTRYLNIEGMLPFENMVADYIKETRHHVMYRVTPIFEGDNLVASGVLMEGRSVEDEDILFCVYAYNVQPGVAIDYATGDNWAAQQAQPQTQEGEQDYVLNTGNHKFHLPTCSSVEKMKSKNREYFHGSRQALLDQGYSPCGSCKP